MDGVVRNEIELITRYREMSMQPECETAIDEIVNEAIVTEDEQETVEINLDKLQVSAQVKQAITAEFDYCLKLLDFSNSGHDLFRRWYIDGRLFYHIIVDPANPTEGVQELRYIDPRRIRKMREVQKTKSEIGMDIIKQVNEYFLYNDRGVVGGATNLGIKIAVDSILNVNSGLMDSKRAMVLSYLHKAIKPLNQLRMVEDATVIYRLSRAPERRVFYIDVGNMPTAKAEEYLKKIMVNYRNKLVYDSSTGQIRDDRKFLSILEDFWLPRREGSKGTEISTLPGGENLGVMTDVEYFEKKMYKSLGVPLSRLMPQDGFSLGRTTEITREELKFAKFISRLRNKFSMLFDNLMRVQLVLKGICTEEEWKTFKEDVHYDYLKDNNFDELKEAELLTNRVSIVTLAQPYVGMYFSREWVRKNILQQTDEDIAEIDAQITAEAEVDAEAMAEQQAQQQAMMPQQPQVGPDGQPVPQQMFPPPPPGQPDPNEGVAQAQEEMQPPNKFEVSNDDVEVEEPEEEEENEKVKDKDAKKVQ